VIKAIFSWLTGGVLDRVLDTVDRRIDAETTREALKADIIQEAYKQRADWMRAGGALLTYLFAVPLALHFASVIVYGWFWCAQCAFPQEWIIAELPEPLDEWAWLIVISIFGVVGISNVRRN
jgi:hypothetical protein